MTMGFGPFQFLSPQTLTSLTLRENRISELPAEIGQLTQLRSLDVSHNNLHHLPEGVRGGEGVRG